MTKPSLSTVIVAKLPFIFGVLVSASSLLLGCLALLLLNGQVFSNALFFIGMVATSSMIWLWILVKWRTRATKLIVIAHLAAIAISAINLPAKYKAQVRFNAKLNAVQSS